MPSPSISSFLVSLTFMSLCRIDSSSWCVVVWSSWMRKNHSCTRIHISIVLYFVTHSFIVLVCKVRAMATSASAAFLHLDGAEVYSSYLGSTDFLDPFCTKHISPYSRMRCAGRRSELYASCSAARVQICHASSSSMKLIPLLENELLRAV